METTINLTVTDRDRIYAALMATAATLQSVADASPLMDRSLQDNINAFARLMYKIKPKEQ